MVEAVRNMFPDISTAAIQADLAITGSVEVTCNKIISQGGLPIPQNILPPEAAQSGGTATSTGTNVTGSATTPGSLEASRGHASSSNTSEPAPNSLLQRFKLDTSTTNATEPPVSPEPEKVWKQDSSARQETLFQRKQFMVLEARRKLLEKQKREQEVESKSSTSKQD